MDWSKLSLDDLRAFVEANSPNSYINCSQMLFTNRTPDTKITDPVVDLYIASQFKGNIAPKYDIGKIRHLSSKKLREFAKAFGIKPDKERIIRILGFMDALILPNHWESLPQELFRRIVLELDAE